MLTREFLLYGQADPPAPRLALHAGPLRLLYDPLSGFVRHIRLGDREVLRGIYAAVRDRNWGTVTGVVRELRRLVESHRFAIEFESDHRRDDIHFVWHGRIEGGEDGTLRYQFEGEAKRAFLRNRIGLCVLHPIAECAGARARQTRTDGTVIECHFPGLIEPQIVGRSSFRDLRAVAHEIEPGLWAEVTMEGDTFEMEDQRNWSDASFKTYGTPLDLPFPVEIRAGTLIHQIATLRLLGKPARTSRMRAGEEPGIGPVTIVVPESPSGAMPRLGLGMASHGQPLAGTEAVRLRGLSLAHLRVDLRLALPRWREALEAAGRVALELGAGLELALHLPGDTDPALGGLAEALGRGGIPVARLLALREGEAATSPQTLALVRRHLAALRAPIGSGTDRNFCELNREQALGRLGLAGADFLFWPSSPQVHGSDHLTLVENLAGQGEAARSARASRGGRALVISPVTLRPRFNAVATGPDLPVPEGVVPPQVDPRQLSLFGAAWTLGSLAALAEAGVESITYYETTGWRGLMESGTGSPLPGKFPSLPGQVFPLFHVFAAVAGFSRIATTRVSTPLALAALTLFNGERQVRVLAANLTDRIRQVRFVGLAGSRVELRCLDERSALRGLRPWRGGSRAAPPGTLEVSLPAYAMVCVDPRP